MQDSLYGYKIIYVKLLNSFERFYDGKNVYLSLLADNYFKSQFKLGKDYILSEILDDGSQYLIMDITSVASGGSISTGANQKSKLSGMNIVNYGSMFNIKDVVYKRGSSLFEAGMHDRIMVLQKRDERFEEHLGWDEGVIYNEYVRKLFIAQGESGTDSDGNLEILSDYYPMFYGYVDTTGFNFSRNPIITISASGSLKRLENTHMNLAPALIDEFNFGTKFYGIQQPYTRMKSWEIMVDLIIKSFNLDITLDEVRNKIKITNKDGRRVITGSPDIYRRIPNVDGGKHFVELRSSERVVARIEIIELDAYSFALQNLKLYENTLKTAYDMAKDVAKAVNAFLYDDGDGIIYFRTLSNTTPRILIDGDNKGDSYLDELFTNLKVSFNEAMVVSGIIGTSGWYPGGVKEFFPPGRNITMYLNDFNTKKYGLKLKQMKPEYGFTIKTGKSDKKTGAEVLTSVIDAKNKNFTESKFKIVFDAYVSESPNKEMFFTDKDGNKHYAYQINQDFVDYMKSLIDRTAALRDRFDVYELKTSMDEYLDDWEKLELIKSIKPDLVLQIRVLEDPIQDSFTTRQQGQGEFEFKIPSDIGTYLLSGDSNVSKQVVKNLSNNWANKYRERWSLDVNYLGEPWGSAIYTVDSLKFESIRNDLAYRLLDDQNIFTLNSKKEYKNLFGSFSKFLYSSSAVTFVPAVMSPEFSVSSYTDYDTEWYRYEDMKYIYAATLLNNTWAYFKGLCNGTIVDLNLQNASHNKNYSITSVTDVKRALADYMLASYDSMNANVNKVSLDVSFGFPQWRVGDTVWLNKDGYERIYFTDTINRSIGVHDVGSLSIGLNNERYPICLVGDEESYNRWADIYYNNYAQELLGGYKRVDKISLKTDYDNITKEANYERVIEAVDLYAVENDIDRDNLLAVILAGWDLENYGLDFQGVYVSDVNTKFDILNKYKSSEGDTRGTVRFVSETYVFISDKVGKSLQEISGVFRYGFTDYIKAKSDNFSESSQGEVEDYVISVIVMQALILGKAVSNIYINYLSTRIMESQIQAYRSSAFIFGRDGEEKKMWSPWGVFDYGNVGYINESSSDHTGKNILTISKKSALLLAYKLPITINMKKVEGWWGLGLTAKQGLLDEVSRQMGTDEFSYSDSFKKEVSRDGIYNIRVKGFLIIDISLVEGFTKTKQEDEESKVADTKSEFYDGGLK